MKKLFIIIIFTAIILVACDNEELAENYDLNYDYETIYYLEENETIETEFIIANEEYMTFEEILLEATSDIVIAQYVGSRPFGDNDIEFEFIVSENLLGESTQRIFVFASTNVLVYVKGSASSLSYLPGDLYFEHGVDYLLPLNRLLRIHAHEPREEDEFIFVRQTVVNLENPEESSMYSEDLDGHVEGIDITEATTAEEIIEFVEEFAEIVEAEDRWTHVYIDSDDIHDIIYYSPFVFIVEPTELISSGISVWMSTDIFNVNITEVLKGEAPYLEDIIITFGFGNATIGEKIIIAAQPLDEGATDWYILTSSNNSIFSINQLDEIQAILTEEISADGAEEDIYETEVAEEESDDASEEAVNQANFLEFENMIVNEATHVVVGQFVQARAFGDFDIAFEFIVTNQLLSQTTQRILVFGPSANVSAPSMTFEFVPGASYILPLSERIVLHPTSPAYESKFSFVRNTVIDLANPENSKMDGAHLNEQSGIIDFMTTEGEEIADYISAVSQFSTANRRFSTININTSDMRTIITGSPFVFVLEVGELVSSGTSAWVSTDIFNVNIVETLKADGAVLDEIMMTFALGSVATGDILIVAAQPIDDGATDWFNLTSSFSNSLFSINEIEAIRQILEN